MSVARLPSHAVWAALALMGVGCLPAWVDPHGKACDQRGGCPSPLVCAPNNVCVATDELDGGLGGGAVGGGAAGGGGGVASDGGDAGPQDDGGTLVNLVQNGDFADGLLNWEDNGRAHVTYAANGGRDGGGAARVTDTGDTSFSYMGVVSSRQSTPLPQVGDVFCSEGWVRPLSAGLGQMETFLRAYSTGTSCPATPTYCDSPREAGTGATSADGGWVRLRSRLYLREYGVPYESWTVRFSATPGSGVELLVDDIRVWKGESDGGC